MTSTGTIRTCRLPHLVWQALRPLTLAPQYLIGTLPSPCGQGAAKGATDQGVTDTAIHIAYGDDRGFTGAPGLNKEMGDAVKAMDEALLKAGLAKD